ncbi:MAG TPA: hypothetical protein VJK54_01545 [Chthoniobacterales bacterium]|nr:hypothetical protein [Chthoniobacterales bacterium]
MMSAIETLARMEKREEKRGLLTTQFNYASTQKAIWASKIASANSKQL